jgi:hypothetical protein
MSESQDPSSSPQQQPYTVLNSKNSKPCNNVAFSLTDPKLLATGFERNRNEFGLLVWDVEKTTLSPSSEDKGHGGGAPEAPRTNNMNFNKNFDRDHRDRDRDLFRMGEDSFPLGILTIQFKLIKNFLSLFFLCYFF